VPLWGRRAQREEEGEWQADRAMNRRSVVGVGRFFSSVPAASSLDGGRCRCYSSRAQRDVMAHHVTDAAPFGCKIFRTIRGSVFQKRSGECLSVGAEVLRAPSHVTVQRSGVSAARGEVRARRRPHGRVTACPGASLASLT
jgi:hypothetical protein